MANSDNAEASLDMASSASNLEDVIVVGRDADGKIAFFTTDVDRERMIALLERARSKLVRMMDE